MRKHALLTLQILLSAFLLWRIFGDPELRQNFGQIISSSNPLWLVAGLAFAVLTETLCAVRWWLMLRLFGVPVSLPRTIAFSGAGLFFSLGLPGSGGGDAFRIIYVMRLHPHRKFHAVMSVVADRLCGLFALMLTIAFPLSHSNLFAGEPQAAAILGSAGAVLGATAILVFVWWLTTWPSLHRRWIHLAPEKIRPQAVRLGRIFGWMKRHPGAVLIATGLSLLSLGAHFSTYWMSTKAVGLSLTFSDMLVVMPLVDTLTMLPITLYGIGLRETLFEYLLGGLFQIETGAATLASLGGFSLQALVGLAGGLLVPLTLPSRQGSTPG